MRKNKSIQVKAAFLLMVFALNTLVGFLCSMGIKMGFNNHHHQAVQASSANAHHHHKQTPANDDCCNKNAIQLQQTNKWLGYNQVSLSQVPFSNIVSSFLAVQRNFVYACMAYVPATPQCYPPPDIRVAIRSFQI